MRPSRACARALAAALVLVATLACGRDAAASPGARLHALQARYDAHLREARPDLGSRAGLAHCDDRLVPITEASLARDESLLAALTDSAAALANETLGPGDRRALAELRERLEREAAPLRGGDWRREPSAYLSLVHDAVFDAARRPRISPCERERRTLKRLRAVPEILRSAEVNLAAAAAFDPDSETVRWNAALLDLRTTLPGLFADCHDAERYADLVEADSLALGAARRFTALMRALPGPSSRP